MGFRCPLCRTTVYEQLPAGGPGPCLYACAGCTFVFADPDRASTTAAGVPGQPIATPNFGRALATRKGAPRPTRARGGQRSR